MLSSFKYLLRELISSFKSTISYQTFERQKEASIHAQSTLENVEFQDFFLVSATEQGEQGLMTDANYAWVILSAEEKERYNNKAKQMSFPSFEEMSPEMQLKKINEKKD